jgi:monoamine oxidase
MNRNSGQKKVVIIGAGIAGLAACRQLMQDGFEVLILEARDCAGGRIVTGDCLGVPLGSGAAWIHGADGNPISTLANQFRAEMVPVHSSQFAMYNRDGQPISNKDIAQFETRFNQFLEKAKALAFQSEKDISLADALSVVTTGELFSTVEEDLLQRKHLFFEGYVGANDKYLSARNWDMEDIWPGDNCFLTSGYGPILDGLVKGCPIRFNTSVLEVRCTSEAIEIVTKNSVFHADAVIVTVPLGVLKSGQLTFSPPLPKEKRMAIQNLGMGLFNITAIRFESAFWPREPQAFFFTKSDELLIPVFLNLYHFTGEPILVGYSGGDRARRLEAITDEELIAITMQHFEKHFATSLPPPTAYLNTRWSKDPYSFGSYSCVTTGASKADFEALAEPVANRLFFAGEATNGQYPSTTHGAYLSGIREAERIKNTLLCP